MGSGDDGAAKAGVSGVHVSLDPSGRRGRGEDARSSTVSTVSGSVVGDDGFYQNGPTQQSSSSPRQQDYAQKGRKRLRTGGGGGGERKRESLRKLSVTFSLGQRLSFAAVVDEDQLFEREKDHIAELNARGSPWASLWLCNLVQFLCGIQFSIYFTSIWPYLSGLDKDATLSFLGWIIASYSVGQGITSPLFGLWNQRWLSTRWPAATGVLIAAVGNLLYAALPVIDSQVKWLMMVSRFLVGLGSGNLSVLSAYVATASAPKDRGKAVAISIAGYVLGISLGPAIQAAFTPVGKKGWSIGSWLFNMYTIPAYVMVVINAIAIALLLLIFRENYAGIISKDERKAEPFFVLPKFDWIPACICIYLWYVQNSISTNVETMTSPWTIAMFGWSDSDAVLYNGIFQFLQCFINVLNYGLIAFTPVGEIDRRKHIFVGLLVFLLYHIINLPWGFYYGPLSYAPYDNSTHKQSTENHGGCLSDYHWCEHSRKVPLPLYIFGATVCFGFGFPYLGNSIGTLYSQILGPRNQGNMQGVLAFFGSLSRCIAPLVGTALFENSGYVWPMVMQIAYITLALVLCAVFYNRLVPLKVTPDKGDRLRYKGGMLYRL